MEIPSKKNISLSSPMELNDWPLFPFIALVLLLQIVIILVIFLNTMGIVLPGLREVSFFFYLTFIPGFLLLRIFNLHRIGIMRSIMYAIGLSIFLVMGIGGIINFLYPALGIRTPITLYPLLITFSGVILTLSILCYIRDWKFQGSTDLKFEMINSPAVLVLSILPFLAIIGTYLVNSEKNSVILLGMITVIFLLIIIIGLTGFLPKDLYPYAIFCISLALLFHTSLISYYLTGWDVQFEYYFAKIVEQAGFWDTTIPLSNANAMLSVVMLPPIYSILSGLDIAWIYKIIFPFIFAFVPVGLYEVYRKVIGQKEVIIWKSVSHQEHWERTIAFLPVIFFISIPTFFTEMLGLCRQQLAEFFLVLIFFVIVDNEVAQEKRFSLSYIFVTALIVSHYGTAWMFMGIFILSFIVLLVIGKRDVRTIMGRVISPPFLAFYISVNFVWHLMISSSMLLGQVETHSSYILDHIGRDFFQIYKSQPIKLLEYGTWTFLHSIDKYLNIIGFFIIAIGAVIVIGMLFIRSRKLDFLPNHEFKALIIATLMILSSGFLMPSLYMMNALRVYHIALLTIAPLSVICIIACCLCISFVSRMDTNRVLAEGLSVFTLFIAVLFIFNSGFIYELAKDDPESISLSQTTIGDLGNIHAKNKFYSNYIPETTIYGLNWIEKRQVIKAFYSDTVTNKLHARSYGTRLRGIMDIAEYNASDTYAYIFLSYLNTQYGVLNGVETLSDFRDIQEIEPILNERSIIYSNKFSEIYQ